MHPQLAAVIADLEAASRRLHALSTAVPAEQWPVRADPKRWSVGECVAHLNLTSHAFLPDLRRAIADPVLTEMPAPARYPLGITGRLLYHLVGPVKRFMGVRLTIPVKTTAAFVPAGDLPREQIVAEFETLQRELVDITRASDGKPIQIAMVRSPFSARAMYNMYAALAIIPRHQHRHLQQAEEVWGGSPR